MQVRRRLTRIRWGWTWIAAISGLIVETSLLAGQGPSDPFDFFRPSIVVTADDRQRLDRGEAVVRLLPGDEGEVATFAATAVNADGQRLAAWVHHIVDLKKSAFVKKVVRFSDPPRLEDLAPLVLSDQDLDAVRQCRPGACKIKLTAAEIASLHETLVASGDDWKPAVQDTFRRVMFDRVQAYLANGQDAIAPYVDHPRPVLAPKVFAGLLEHSPYLSEHLPRIADYLAHFPQPSSSMADPFLYWSIEQPSGRPILSATHVTVAQYDREELPETVVASKQIFATHYLNGSLNITALLCDRVRSRHYLVYVNRSRVDVLDRWFGSMARSVIERRIRSEAPDVLQGVRQRLEGGEPPSSD